MTYNLSTGGSTKFKLLTFHRLYIANLELNFVQSNLFSRNDLIAAALTNTFY